LFIKPGETIIRSNVYYLGTVKVNLIGYWRKSLSKPLWIMTSLEPKRGLDIYQQRMKIEQTFKDCKDLLHLAKLMNKQQRYLEQMIALALIAYVIGLWCGEAIRDVVYGKLPVEKLKENLFGDSQVDVGKYPKWLNYSGLFVLLKQKRVLPKKELERVIHTAARAFSDLFCSENRSCSYWCKNLQIDFVTKLLQTANHSSCRSLDITFVEEIASQVAIRFFVLDHVIRNNQDGMGYSDDSFLFPSSTGQTVVLCGQVRILHP
jgi:hypothetical protein